MRNESYTPVKEPFKMRRVTVTGILTLCFLLTLAIGASHAATPWKLSGIYLESCNCDIPCPCATGGAPTHGNCQAFVNWHIAHGFYGDVSLNDLNVTIMLDIPGKVEDGNWTIATYIDDRATPEQIEAIKSIIQEDMGPFVAEDLGVKSVPIGFGMQEGLSRELKQPSYHGMSGDTYRWIIPDILEIESTLRRDMPSVPGYYAHSYYQAEAVVQTYKDHGREWDFAGKNSFQGRLLLPPEEPSDKVIATIRAGTASEGVDVNPYTCMAVVTNRADGTISLIDLDAQKQVKIIPIGVDPIGPRINPYTNIAVIPARGEDVVYIVDLETETVKKSIPVGEKPACAGLDPGMNIAVVGNTASKTVSVIDLETEEVTKTIPVSGMPVCMHWNINPFTKQAIVVVFGANALSVIDLEEGVEIQTIPMEAGVAPGASMNPYTNMAVVPIAQSNSAAVVDLTRGEVVATIPVGKNPICSVIEPTMNLALVSNADSDDVSVIDLDTLSVVDTITVGVKPACMAIDEATMTAVVSNHRSHEITIIDLKKISTAAEDYSRTFFLQLESGLNMISLPLRPLTQRTARDLMNEIGATMVIKLDAQRSRFVGFTEADSGDGFSIEGGQGYIVNVKNSKIVPFVGAAWTNEPPLAAAPTLETDSAWAFVVSGALNLPDDKTGWHGGTAPTDSYTIQARNLRTSVITTDLVSKSGYFALASADLSKKSIIQATDKLEIIAKDASGNVVSRVVCTIDADNIGKAYLNVPLRLGDIIPSQTALLQNYPNPFNPETWIPFALAEDSLVTVNIYDTNGRLVRRFALGERGAGVYTSKDHALYWDGRNETGERVSSGIYFYQLRAEDFTAVRRLVIMK